MPVPAPRLLLETVFYVPRGPSPGFARFEGQYAVKTLSAATPALSSLLSDGDGFGAAVASLDLDADGVPDLAIGAPYDGTGGSEVGAVYVVLMERGGEVKAVVKLSAESSVLEGRLREGDRFGASLAWNGDMDGDGVPDLIVGVEGAGSLRVLYMTATGDAKSTATLSPTTGALSGMLSDGDTFNGRAVAAAGDIDGDGVVDLAVGGSNAVYVLLMQADGEVKAATKIDASLPALSDILPSEGLFGASIASIGDLSGDGVPDLVVSSATLIFALFLTTSGGVQAAVKSLTVFDFIRQAPGIAGISRVSGQGEGPYVAC